MLRAGGVGVLPTDTLYGLVGLARRPKTVQRIYRLKRRAPPKPFIILIDSLMDLNRFGTKINPQTRRVLTRLWPGPISVVLPSRRPKTLAFRMPRNKPLRRILKQTGPLVAPSANPEGKKPAETIKEAKKYFGGKVDFYLSAGKRLAGPPSTLVALDENGRITVLR